MRLEHLTWPQAEAYFKTHDTVILPIGSIECHGRHMPLGTDALIPARLLELLEPQCPDTLIAPLLPYGACDSQTDFPGTISLGHDVLYQVLTNDETLVTLKPEEPAAEETAEETEEAETVEIEIVDEIETAPETDLEWAEGDSVTVYYNGMMSRSIPAQVTAMEIVVIR